LFLQKKKIMLNKGKFSYAIILLAQKLFPGEKKKIDMIFNELLKIKTIVLKGGACKFYIKNTNNF